MPLIADSVILLPRHYTHRYETTLDEPEWMSCGGQGSFVTKRTFPFYQGFSGGRTLLDLPFVPLPFSSSFFPHTDLERKRMLGRKAHEHRIDIGRKTNC